MNVPMDDLKADNRTVFGVTLPLTTLNLQLHIIQEE